MWIVFAILSAIFASLMSLLMKGSMRVIDATFATAIRTSITFILCWILVFFNKSYQEFSKISTKNWWLLVLAGIVTFATWISFFIALKLGPVAKVLAIDRLSIILTVILAAIFYKEVITLRIAIGIVITLIGVALVIM